VTYTFVRNNNKGRAVFVSEPFNKGETIEVCHILVVDDDFWMLRRRKTPFDPYVYWFDKKAVIALGHGSLYNHSYTPNASWTCRKSSQTIRFFALRDIQACEEITINHNGSPKSRAPMDFEVLT
jgi:hypothetical protein